MNVLIYARASTREQDSTRAVPALREFARERGWAISKEYVENASGLPLNVLSYRCCLMRLTMGICCWWSLLTA